MIVSDLNWKTWLRHGDQYLKAAGSKGAFRFDTEIAYNLLGMSLEGYVMAILDIHNSLPENHTFTDLVDALETVYPLDVKLREKILQYESLQSICSVDKYQREKPSSDAVDDLRTAVNRIGVIAHEVCGHVN
ncbi:hypothetical protein [Marinilabilia rubra]|uniref:HEPN domain-containing protein n=1 Tax=Marinilabilia rubra TaxID=2162893 RepID=A0A2U2BBY3_9BACT|nr:hypothetical protein [Marinilabilia rubra]PWE00576.1 hypothetical protein DDZ16_02970 [Marinilabilia rubra]